MVLGLRSLEQMKLDETRDTVEVTISIKPYLLKFFFRALFHTKAIHRDKHNASPRRRSVSDRRLFAPLWWIARENRLRSAESKRSCSRYRFTTFRPPMPNGISREIGINCQRSWNNG